MSDTPYESFMFDERQRLMTENRELKRDLASAQTKVKELEAEAIKELPEDVT